MRGFGGFEGGRFFRGEGDDGGSQNVDKQKEADERFSKLRAEEEERRKKEAEAERRRKNLDVIISRYIEGYGDRQGPDLSLKKQFEQDMWLKIWEDYLAKQSSSQNRKVAFSEVEFFSQYAGASVQKGEKREPKPNEVILDTGDFKEVDFNEFELADLADPEKQEAFLHLPYLRTIEGGVIDHHVIDSYFMKLVQEGRLDQSAVPKKCTAKIIFDYQDRIIDLIDRKNIKASNAHVDGDLDAVCANYFMQYLIQNGNLPKGAKKIAEHVNAGDYGQYRENDPNRYVHSLLGVFSSLKDEITRRRDAARGAEVFSKPEMKGPDGRLNAQGLAKLNEVGEKYENLLIKSTFEIMNLLLRELEVNPDFDLERDMDRIFDRLADDELKEIWKNGREKVLKNFQDFIEDFKKSTRYEVFLKHPKTKESVKYELVLSSEPTVKPLVFTNVAYSQVSPYTIVAVYGGEKHASSGSDNYDIGIKLESAGDIDLSALCVALNQKEKEKREAAGLTLEDLPDRLGMSGQPAEEQVLKKDPTVLVAGNSLIAASRHSLLTAEDFRQVIENFVSR